MDIVKKEIRVHFLITLVLSCIGAVIAHEWLVIILVLWAVLAMGGVIKMGPENQRLISMQFGCLVGLSIALIFIFWGPMELYK